MAFASSRIGAQEAVIIPCDFCEEEEEVNWYCKDCGQNLCNMCKKMHLKGNITKTHELLSISEGFIIAKENASILCDEHSEKLSFHCRTCKKHICNKCLSKNHKKHDFVDLREEQDVFQKKLADVLKQKRDEIESVSRNIDSLSVYKKDFHSYVAACYASIDENAKAIKDATDAETKKLKSQLAAITERKDKEIDESEQSLTKQKDSYAKKISDTERQLRMQTISTLSAFAEQSKSELQALTPNRAIIPTNITLFTEGKINTDHIRGMVGRVDSGSMEKVVLRQEKPDKIPAFLDQLEVVGLFNNFSCTIHSVCYTRNGDIWVGGKGFVFKLDSAGVVSKTTQSRKAGSNYFYECGYIACFTSGDAIVSYGTATYIDRFTSDGRRIEFADMSPSDTYDIALTNKNQVVVNVNRNSLVIFSEQGLKLREIKPNVKPFYTFCLLQDGSYRITEDRFPYTYLVTVDRNGTVTRRQRITTSEIGYITCDRHGNVIASSYDTDSIYVISEDGEVNKTYRIRGKRIGRLTVDKKDRMMIITDDKKITVANYTE